MPQRAWPPTTVGLAPGYTEQHTEQIQGAGMEGSDLGSHVYSNWEEIVNKHCWHEKNERNRRQNKEYLEHCTLLSQTRVN